MSTRFFHIADAEGREFREIDESEYYIEWVAAKISGRAIALLEVPRPGREPDWRVMCVTRRALTEAEMHRVVQEVAARVAEEDQF